VFDSVVVHVRASHVRAKWLRRPLHAPALCQALQAEATRGPALRVVLPNAPGGALRGGMPLVVAQPPRPTLVFIMNACAALPCSRSMHYCATSFEHSRTLVALERLPEVETRAYLLPHGIVHPLLVPRSLWALHVPPCTPFDGVP
jgi:hypothetical protein